MSASDLEAQSQGHQILSCCLNSRPFPPAESKPTVSSELDGLVRNYTTGNWCGGAGRKDGPSVLHWPSGFQRIGGGKWRANGLLFPV